MAENPNRVCSFFATKKPGMFVGSIQGQDLENFIATIKEAKQTTGIVTVFLWTSDKENSKVVASLNAIVGQPRQQSSPQQRRPIGGAPARPTTQATGGNPMAGIFNKTAAAPAAEAKDEGW